MPLIRTSPPIEEATEADLLAARNEFEAAFVPRPNGSLVRYIDGTRLVVFLRRDRWHWCIDNLTDPARFSDEPFAEPWWALSDLWRAWMGVV